LRGKRTTPQPNISENPEGRFVIRPNRNWAAALIFRPRALYRKIWDAFEEGLSSLGYRVGENVAIEYRFAKGDIALLRMLAADLVRLGVDVIIVAGATPKLLESRSSY
jgi:hypothetical protein